MGCRKLDRRRFNLEISRHKLERRRLEFEMRWLREKFIRRFLLHILPHRFVRIRYYGLFAPSSTRSATGALRALLAAVPPSPAPESGEREDWEVLSLSLPAG
ncbi:MAG: transposase, partial [Thermoanaerobaculia bacterium]